MKLQEFQAKSIFADYHIPIPKGIVITKNKIDALATVDYYPVAVKAQVLVGGRGKAGGIRFASNPEELNKVVSELLNSKIRAVNVNSLLVEEKLNIRDELYIGFTIDRSKRLPVLIASKYGGVDIEAVDERELIRFWLNPFTGLRQYMIRKICSRLLQLDASKQLRNQLQSIITNLYKIFCDYDATLTEINPLVITDNNQLISADAKLIIDDDALYRHSELTSLREETTTTLEERARAQDLAFVQLDDGEIGVIANGAGLTMATLDAIKLAGGNPAVFLDLGGGAGRERVKYAVELILEAQPKAILVNIFGGITRCDDVATGIIEVVKKRNINLPIVARIKGTHEAEARALLQSAGIELISELESAINFLIDKLNKLK